MQKLSITGFMEYYTDNPRQTLILSSENQYPSEQDDFLDLNLKFDVLHISLQPNIIFLTNTAHDCTLQLNSVKSIYLCTDSCVNQIIKIVCGVPNTKQCDKEFRFLLC